jgi:hypothetical protein
MSESARSDINSHGTSALREPLTDLTLIPYGCTNLRITEFPYEQKEVQ